MIFWFYLSGLSNWIIRINIQSLETGASLDIPLSAYMTIFQGIPDTLSVYIVTILHGIPDISLSVYMAILLDISDICQLTWLSFGVYRHIIVRLHDHSSGYSRYMSAYMTFLRGIPDISLSVYMAIIRGIPNISPLIWLLFGGIPDMSTHMAIIQDTPDKLFFGVYQTCPLILLLFRIYRTCPLIWLFFGEYQTYDRLHGQSSRYTKHKPA